MKQNYLNPFREETIFPITLNEASNVSIDLIDTAERLISTVIQKIKLSAGKQTIKISRNQLKAGIYFAKITIENSTGKFVETLKVHVK